MESHTQLPPSSRPSAWGSWPGCPQPEAPAVPGKSSALCWAPQGLLCAAGLSRPAPVTSLTHLPGVCPVLLTRQARVGSRDPSAVWRQQGVCRSPGGRAAWGCALSGPARPGRPRRLRPPQSGSWDLQGEVLRSSGCSTVPMGPCCFRTLHVQSRLGSLQDCTLSRNIPALSPTCWLTPSKSCLKRPLPSELFETILRSTPT